LPQVSLEGSYTRLSEVPEIDLSDRDLPVPPGKELEPIKMGDEDNYKAEIKVQQLLFASGQALKSAQAAKKAEGAARHRFLASKEDLARSVTEAFFGVLFAQEMVKAQSEALATAEAHLSDVENRYAQGVASRFELLRSQVEVSNLRPRVTQADNQVKIAKTGLKSLLGFDLDEPIEAVGSLEIAPIELAYPAARDQAFRERHEPQSLTLALSAQKDATWAATAGMLPKAQLMAGYGYQKPWYFDEEWTDLWTVGVGVRIPLFDGLSALGKRRESLARERQFKKQKEDLLEKIDLGLRRAYLDLSEIKGRVAETGENVLRSEESHRIAEDAYKNGAVTNLEVLDSQLARTQASVQHVQALFDFHIARTRILAATGRIIEE